MQAVSGIPQKVLGAVKDGATQRVGPLFGFGKGPATEDGRPADIVKLGTKFRVDTERNVYLRNQKVEGTKAQKAINTIRAGMGVGAVVGLLAGYMFVGAPAIGLTAAAIGAGAVLANVTGYSDKLYGWAAAGANLGRSVVSSFAKKNEAQNVAQQPPAPIAPDHIGIKLGVAALAGLAAFEMSTYAFPVISAGIGLAAGLIGGAFVASSQVEK